MADRIDLPDGNWVEVEGDITIGQWQIWLQAEQERNFKAIAEILSTIVKKWSRPTDPAKMAELFEEIPFRFWRDMAFAVAGWLLTGATGKVLPPK